jgi:hypothetical protein
VRTTEAPGSNRYATHAGRDNRHLETVHSQYFQHAAHVRGTGCDGPHLDWRLIQDAEANAREIATHARVPGPPAARIPDTGRTRRRGALAGGSVRTGQSRKATTDPAALPRRAIGGHTAKKACGNCSP